MPKYRVKVSSHHSEIVTASSAAQAKTKAWNRIKSGYTYGYDNVTEFRQKASAERI